MVARVPGSAMTHWWALRKLLWVSLGPSFLGRGGRNVVHVAPSALSLDAGWWLSEWWSWVWYCCKNLLSWQIKSLNIRICGMAVGRRGFCMGPKRKTLWPDNLGSRRVWVLSRQKWQSGGNPYSLWGHQWHTLNRRSVFLVTWRAAEVTYSCCIFEKCWMHFDIFKVLKCFYSRRPKSSNLRLMQSEWPGAISVLLPCV